MKNVVRKIAVAGVLSAVSVVLGLTRLGFLPWFAGASLTIMHVPVIVGALLEGPIVGMVVGALFGLFSLIQAAAAPNGPIDLAFTNPLISVLPRLLIGVASWLVYRAIRGREEAAAWRAIPAILTGAIVGSLTNTALVLTGLGAFGFIPWATVLAVAIANGLPEAGAAAIIAYLVVIVWKRVGGGRARLAREESA